MRLLILISALLVATTGNAENTETINHADRMVIESPDLGLTILLKQSRAAEPIAALIDHTGKDLSGLTANINSIVANGTLHCAEDGLKGYINQVLDCGWIGFSPLEARVVSMQRLFPEYPKDRRALVVRGLVSDRGRSSLKTIFIPIEILVAKTRNGKSIPWTFADGWIRTDKDYQYRNVNTDQLFSR